MDGVVAGHENTSVAQVACRWLLQRPAVQSVIIGPRNVKQMLDCLNAVTWSMTAEEMTSLNEASAPTVRVFVSLFVFLRDGRRCAAKVEGDTYLYLSDFNHNEGCW